jgi:small subunit ribosomal protein S16
MLGSRRRSGVASSGIRRIYGADTVPGIQAPAHAASALQWHRVMAGKPDGSASSVSLAGLSPTIFRKNIMVVIRLSRGGAKKRPFYNIVVADSRERRDGRYLERLGFYNPMAAGAEQPLRVAMDRLTYWQGVGAQLSPTVERLVKQAAKAVAAPAAAA